MSDAIDAMESIPDAAERARALGEFLNEFRTMQTRAREMRQQAVLTLKAQGLSWAAIGDLLGMGRQRARRIALGESWPKPKTDDEADNE